MAKASEKSSGPPSAFRALGMAKTVEVACEEIRELYLADADPLGRRLQRRQGFERHAPARLAGDPETSRRRTNQADPRHLDRHAGRAAARRRVGRDLARPHANRGPRAGDADPAAQAHAGGRRLVLGQPDRPGLPGARAEVPLVHRAAQDQAVEQVHPRRRAEVRRGDPRPRHAEGREPATGRHHREARRQARPRAARPRTPACPTRSSTRPSRTGTTTTSGSSSCR